MLLLSCRFDANQTIDLIQSENIQECMSSYLVLSWNSSVMGQTQSESFINTPLLGFAVILVAATYRRPTLSTRTHNPSNTRAPAFPNYMTIRYIRKNIKQTAFNGVKYNILSSDPYLTITQLHIKSQWISNGIKGQCINSWPVSASPL